MAHPRQFDEVAGTILRIRVTPAQRRDLAEVARQNHTTISAALREAADEYVADFRDNQPVFGNRRTRADS